MQNDTVDLVDYVLNNDDTTMAKKPQQQQQKYNKLKKNLTHTPRLDRTCRAHSTHTHRAEHTVHWLRVVVCC